MTISKHGWKDTLGSFPVLQHIRNTGRCAQVIFQYIKSAVLPADQIDAGNMYIKIMWYFYAKYFTGIMRTGKNQLGRNNFVFQDLLFRINIF